MRRALLVRAGYEGELVAAFLRSSAAYVGWCKLGDLASVAPATVDELLLERYPECRTATGAPRKHYREILDFVYGAKRGDLVVTPDTANGRFVVGEMTGSYSYDEGSRIWSGGEVFHHSLPVKWSHAVFRADLPLETLRDTDQRGKTTFWLREPTTEAIAAARQRIL